MSISRYNILSEDEISRKHDLMLSYLPEFAGEEEPIINEFLRVAAYEIAIFNKLTSILPIEFNPRYSTIFLSNFEELLGLPVNPDLSDEIRRAIIIAKLNMAYGVTLGFMRDLVQSYDPQGWVEEYCHLYVFEITFKMWDWNIISKLLEKVRYFKPAHLAFNYIYDISSEHNLFYGMNGSFKQNRTIKPELETDLESNLNLGFAIASERTQYLTIAMDTGS